MRRLALFIRIDYYLTTNSVDMKIYVLQWWDGRNYETYTYFRATSLKRAWELCEELYDTIAAKKAIVDAENRNANRKVWEKKLPILQEYNAIKRKRAFIIEQEKALSNERDLAIGVRPDWLSFSSEDEYVSAVKEWEEKSREWSGRDDLHTITLQFLEVDKPYRELQKLLQDQSNWYDFVHVSDDVRKYEDDLYNLGLNAIQHLFELPITRNHAIALLRKAIHIELLDTLDVMSEQSGD